VVSLRLGEDQLDMKTALLVGAIVIGGAGAGFAVERTGLISPVSETSYVATLDEVPYFECPEEVVLGDLYRGDRVFVTGRSADGEWVEIRAPYDTESRVWVDAGWLTPDSSLQAVPGVDCELSELDAAGEPIAVTTTTRPSSSTSGVGSTSSTSSATGTTATTSPPSSTTTSTTASTTTSSTTTTTTVPADQQGPLIQSFQSTESDLWENANYGGCLTQQQTAQVSAVVSDPSGVASAQLIWNVGSSSGTVGMTEIAANVWSVTIGPFSDSTLSGSNAPIALQMTAFDTLSNSSSVSSGNQIPPLLHDCVIG
jgi:hypothetical protein